MTLRELRYSYSLDGEEDDPEETLRLRVRAMEIRLRYLCKTDEAEFERVVKSLQVSEPKVMCRLAYGKQTRMLETIDDER